MLPFFSNFVQCTRHVLRCSTMCLDFEFNSTVKDKLNSYVDIWIEIV